MYKRLFLQFGKKNVAALWVWIVVVLSRCEHISVICLKKIINKNVPELHLLLFIMFLREA